MTETKEEKHTEVRFSKMAIIAFILSFIPCIGLPGGGTLGIIATILIARNKHLKGMFFAIAAICIAIFYNVTVVFIGFIYIMQMFALGVGINADANNLKSIHTTILSHETARGGNGPTPHISMIYDGWDFDLDSLLIQADFDLPEEPIEDIKNAPGIYRYGDFVFCYTGHQVDAMAATDVIAFSAKNGHDGRNVLYGDGSVKWFEEDDFQQQVAPLINTQLKKLGKPQVNMNNF